MIKHSPCFFRAGYVTAVDEYEGGLMLCLDVSHRVLCQTTALELMTNAYNSDPTTVKHNATTALLGAVVLTRYNNKTYRVDDIDFDHSPKDTFSYRGRTISYLEYYKNEYNIEIKDRRQPLLINMTERTIIGQAEKEREMICLIPELCYLTGLTDTMRNDFKVMRDIASITRVTPNQRANSLRTFCANVAKSPAASEILSGWGLTIDPNPLQLQARQLDHETISFARTQVYRVFRFQHKYCLICNNILSNNLRYRLDHRDASIDMPPQTKSLKRSICTSG